jgi:hypothetical protein
VIVGAWLVPFYLRMGLEGVKDTLGMEAAERFYFSDLRAAALHFIGFPLEFFACLLPWGALLLLFARRDLRRSVRETKPMVLFIVVCIAVAFPTCWFALGARPRYLLPIFPCFAPLIGLVVQRCVEAAPGSPLRRWWRWYLTAFVFVLALVPLAAVAGPVLERRFGWNLAQPPGVAFGLAVAIYALLALALRERDRPDPVRTKLAVFALAGCVALTYSVLFVNNRVARGLPAAELVAQVKEQVGDARLVSFGRVHHLFAYHYQGHLPVADWPRAAADLPADVDYFCFDPRFQKELPFAWEKVGEVNCDRRLRDRPIDVVVVGRRLQRAAQE